MNVLEGPVNFSGAAMLTYVKSAEVGTVIRVKGNPKNRSPYVIVQEFSEDGTALVSNIDAPGNGNRRQRRARFRELQRAKK